MFALDCEGSDVGEASDQDRRADGVTVGDEHVAPAPPFDVVPGFGDQGHGVAVEAGGDEGEHVLKSLIGKPRRRRLGFH